MDIGVETTVNEATGLLDELEGLLKRQIELAHQGDAAGEQFDVLTARAGSLVETVSQLGPSGSGQFQHRLEKLRKLYETLSLVVAAEKADVSEELGRIRRGRKIIGTYRRNI
ncbi:MAG: hypothetical protein JSW66_01695 [Phycisphaerales bacterium]|nr:MAG: hypothetical protein JSW66_01695 [Phycisphaerales bacterium]